VLRISTVELPVNAMLVACCTGTTTSNDAIKAANIPLVAHLFANAMSGVSGPT
jgi:hypothetical protein